MNGANLPCGYRTPRGGSETAETDGRTYRGVEGKDARTDGRTHQCGAETVETGNRTRQDETETDAETGRRTRQDESETDAETGDRTHRDESETAEEMVAAEAEHASVKMTIAQISIE